MLVPDQHHFLVSIYSLIKLLLTLYGTLLSIDARGGVAVRSLSFNETLLVTWNSGVVTIKTCAICNATWASWGVGSLTAALIMASNAATILALLSELILSDVKMVAS